MRKLRLFYKTDFTSPNPTALSLHDFSGMWTGWAFRNIYLLYSLPWNWKRIGRVVDNTATECQHISLTCINWKKLLRITNFLYILSGNKEKILIADFFQGGFFFFNSLFNSLTSFIDYFIICIRTSCPNFFLNQPHRTTKEGKARHDHS